MVALQDFIDCCLLICYGPVWFCFSFVVDFYCCGLYGVLASCCLPDTSACGPNLNILAWLWWFSRLLPKLMTSVGTPECLKDWTRVFSVHPFSCFCLIIPRNMVKKWSEYYCYLFPSCCSLRSKNQVQDLQGSIYCLFLSFSLFCEFVIVQFLQSSQFLFPSMIMFVCLVLYCSY